MGIATFSYCFSGVERSAWDLESSQLKFMHISQTHQLFFVRFM